jgi:uncharacterized protein
MAVEIKFEVIYALPNEVYSVSASVDFPATVEEAINASGIKARVPALVIGESPVGIFGRIVKWSDAVSDGDRIEIYRPLTLSPMEARRQLASS